MKTKKSAPRCIVIRNLPPAPPPTREYRYIEPVKSPSIIAFIEGDGCEEIRAEARKRGTEASKKTRARHVWTAKEEKKLVKMYRDGDSWVTMGKAFKVGRDGAKRHIEIMIGKGLIERVTDRPDHRRKKQA